MKLKKIQLQRYQSKFTKLDRVFQVFKIQNLKKVLV